MSPAKGSGARLVALNKLIAATASPTGHESRRRELVAELWRGAGLAPTTDEVGNLLADLPGGSGPRVALVAHLDSVFGGDVDVTVSEIDGVLHGPGVGDNAASLAVLTALAEGKGSGRLPRVTLVATVGEEGLGDLRGAKHFVASRGAGVDHFVAVDGHLGSIVATAVGSRRYEARFSADGGHAWGDYPSPSAVHAAGEAIAALARLHVPREPRSSLNVGQVSGGTSVNAIAGKAWFNLDLRSVDAASLATLEAAAVKVIASSAAASGAELELVCVGDRPAASSENARLVRAAVKALATVDVPVRDAPGSTDANAAMAAGLSAIAFGVYRGGNAHRLDEWVEAASLTDGLEALRGLLADLAR